MSQQALLGRARPGWLQGSTCRERVEPCYCFRAGSVLRAIYRDAFAAHLRVLEAAIGDGVMDQPAQTCPEEPGELRQRIERWDQRQHDGDQRSRDERCYRAQVDPAAVVIGGFGACLLYTSDAADDLLTV